VNGTDAVIRVLLAEDMALIRGALVALLAGEDDINVVAEIDRMESIIPAARRVKPDIVVFDMGIPGVDGLSAARKLQEELPHCRTVILSGTASPRTLRRALDANVRGFVVKDAPPHQLADTIRRVAGGECVIDSELAMSALLNPDGPLTEREHEVLASAAEGASVTEIACQLSLAAGTVRNYLSAVISKLGARNRIDAVRIARDAGWI
jgi:two-component system response regulator DesR